MTTSLHGPGILFVRSCIAHSAKDILDEETFLKWYDNEHITEVVATSGISSGFRYVDINKTSACGNTSNAKPFLAFYPLDDLAFMLSDEFRKIGFRSANLPGTGIIYDMADLDVSYLGLTHKGKRTRNHAGPVDYIVTCGFRPTQSIPASNNSITTAIQDQTKAISKSTGYLRTLTFELQYARTNAQSRKFKGLPTSDEASPEPSTQLTLYEFFCPPEAQILQYLITSVAKLEGDGEVIVWSLDRAHGQGRLFD